MGNLDTLIQDLVIANRILAREEGVDAYGHVSVRHPDNPNRFLIARSLAPELVGPEDIVELDLDGQPVRDEDRSLYLERFIHAEIFAARPDALAVVSAGDGVRAPRKPAASSARAARPDGRSSRRPRTRPRYTRRWSAHSAKSAMAPTGYRPFCGSAFWRARLPAIGPGQQVTAAGLVCPIFPGAPSLDRIRAVAAVAGLDFALRQVLDLAAQLPRAHQGACVA